jgi:hypothetical protein
MAQTTYTLTTFIEPDPEDAEVPDRYLAGFAMPMANPGASSCHSTLMTCAVQSRARNVSGLR